MAGNQEQIEYWNGAAGTRWVKYQEDFDRAIDAFGEAALARLPLAPGARVLDVGCGAGTSTLGIVLRVAPAGAVVAVDVSQPLLARARERVAARAAELGVAVDFVLADAATYRADEACDALFSRFGVMFFDQPARAFGNLREALTAGGKLAFVCWRAFADNPWVTVPLAAARRVLPAPSPWLDPRAPGPFAFAERDYVHELLAQAGFHDIALTPFDAPVILGTGGLQASVDQALRLGPTGRLIADQREEVVARVRDELTRALTPLLDGNSVSLPGAAWVVTARAA
jgi:SAM-dependent methyltransferase